MQEVQDLSLGRLESKMEQKEAKWISDLETLKAHQNKFKKDDEGYLCYDTRESCESYMRVNYENSCRYVDEENEKIRKEKEANKKPLKEQVWELLLMKERGKAVELIVEDFLKTRAVYTIRQDEKVEMWIYNEGIFIPNAQTFIKERCDDLLGVTNTTNITNQVIFKIEVRSYIEQSDFFKEESPHLIAVQNGILDLKKNILIPFNPDFRFFNKLPMNYNPKATCNNIIKFFKSTLKDEKEIKVIQELFGFLLYREYFLEKAFMFLGSGRNGKGKTIDLMKRFLGIENCSEISLEDLEKDIYSLGELFKKMANLSGDLSRSALKHTGNFKKLTGRDLVSGARKFKSRVNFDNYSKMIFACNELPVTYDITLAFFNRWIIIDFPFTFLTQKEMEKENDKENLKLQDPEIIKKIATKDELEGLLIWALEGLKRLFDNKTFSLSPSTEETKTKWLRKSDSFQGFIMDCLVEDEENHVLKTDLKKAYSKYCKKYKLRISGDKIIKILIETLMGGWDERVKVGETQKYAWFGIRLMEDTSYGSYASRGIHLSEEKVKSDIGTETPSCIATLTCAPFEKFEKKPQSIGQFSAEDIQKSGLNPELIKQAMGDIPMVQEPQLEPKSEPKIQEIQNQETKSLVPIYPNNSSPDISKTEKPNEKPNEKPEETREEFEKKMGGFGF